MRHKMGLILLAALLLGGCVPALVAAGVCAAGAGIYIAVDTRDAPKDAGADR